MLPFFYGCVYKTIIIKETMRPIILLDGSIGQVLVKRASEAVTPLWSARVMLDHQDMVTQLYKEYIKAGAKILTLNTYTATPGRLRRDADISLLEPIHEKAMQSAKQAIAETNTQGDVKIAACLPPLMASYNADVIPSYENCVRQYVQLCELQAEADLFLCETLSSVIEAKAAIAAAKSVAKDKPIWVSYTLDDDNPECLRSGEVFKDVLKQTAAEPVEAILMNCSMPETIDAALPDLLNSFPVVGAYANAFQSVKPLQPGRTVSSLKARNDITEDVYRDIAMAWVDKGVQIIGGCCEVGPDHIDVLAKALKQQGYQLVSNL